MRLVLNANVLFAAIIKDAATRVLLENPIIELYAPPVLLFEEQKYKWLLAEKSSASPAELDELALRLRNKAKIIEPSVFYMQQALLFSPDPNDVPYLALCLQVGCPLWSNDKRLKEQVVVPVFSTHDLRSHTKV